MKEIIEFGDRKFLLYRTVREFEKLDPNILKEYWYCDTVLKKEDMFYFCNEIKEIEKKFKIKIPIKIVFNKFDIMTTT